MSEPAGAATAAEGPPPARRRSARRAAGLGFWGVIAIVFGLFPLLVTDPTTTSIAFFTLVFMVAAASWNIFSGYTGYLALGHAVFFGSGGYGLALLCEHLHVGGGWASFALLPLCGIIAALIAVPVGLVALRTRRHTFVVVTIAIFFIFQLAAFNLGFTGGTSGLFLPAAPWLGASYNRPFYYVALAILVLTIAASWLVRRSRFGLQLLAIRDDEDRALGMGVQTRKLKLSAFMLSALFVGMAGGLYFDFIGELFPNTAFDPLFDLSIALMAFFGGMGTLVGPLFGALVLESMQQYLTLSFSSNATYLIAYGALFLAVILIMPQGVVPSIQGFLARRRARAAAPEPTGREQKLAGVAGATR
ncbi:MAG: branched-chain amino acid ABC transporter permease [Conexibacteraceae bacterium]|nr:branched-chain amino acid ABC transporter permease [Conexibacteraceae bacterium]